MHYDSVLLLPIEHVLLRHSTEELLLLWVRCDVLLLLTSVLQVYCGVYREIIRIHNRTVRIGRVVNLAYELTTQIYKVIINKAYLFYRSYVREFETSERFVILSLLFSQLRTHRTCSETFHSFYQHFLPQTGLPS